MSQTATVEKRKRINISSAASLLVATMFAGQLLGFLRTKLVNANFPAVGPHSTDAYFAAFAIPDFFYFTLAAGALGVAFMPVLSDRLQRGDRKGMWEISSSLMNMLAIVMAIVGVIMFVFARPLIENIVAPGLSPQQLDTATTIMRLLAFNPLLFTISGVLNSVQQTMGRFFFYAIAPLIYNIAIIVSIFVFKDNIGLVGLGIGALVGAFLQLGVVCIGTIGSHFHYRPKILWNDGDFRIVLRNLPPRSLDQGIDQVEGIVEVHIASSLGSGSITYFSNAYVLATAPILLIGTAISTAAFPRLNQRLSQGRPDLFRHDFLMVLRAMIWISVPLVIICFFCRGYLARLIYSQGNLQIAIIFGFMIPAIFFRIQYALISRWFYAQKDTKTPLFVSVFVIGLNIILAYMLAKPSAYGVAGLALAQSIVAFVEVAILGVIMVIRDHKLFDVTFWNGVFKIISVSGFSVLTCYILITLYPLSLSDRGVITLGAKVLLIASVTMSVHVALSSLFGLEETKPIIAKARKLMLKPIKFS